MPIKSFRGCLADEAIDTISLRTNDGSVGYRIVKFQIMAEKPSQQDQESFVKIYKIPQTTATSEIDFSDQTLLAAAIWTGNTNLDTYPIGQVVIFDNEIFNQDIYVTHEERRDVGRCNYYIELEQIRLDLNENTVATLKDIRNIEGPQPT